jgi:hypothetical protein
MVLSGFVVRFVCHSSFLWEISRRDPTRRPVNSSSAVAEDSRQLQEINSSGPTPCPLGSDPPGQNLR